MRRTPYTQIGIARVPCFRCGFTPSAHQWQICADGNQYRAVCVACDIALNEAVLRFMRFPNREAMMQRYRRERGR